MTTLWDDLREEPTRLQRWRAMIRRQPSAILLATQLIVILALPWLQSGTYGRLVLILLSLSAVTLGVITVRSTPAMTWLSILLGLPAAAMEVATLFVDSSTLTASAHGALGVFYLYTAFALIAYTFEDAWVTKDELFAVGACFTVLLFAFAYFFLAIQEVHRGSFSAFDGVGQRTMLELIYFSGANLTSVGLSDIVAIQPLARAVTTIEQLGGVVYVAMVISRLVALTVMRNR